MSTATKYKRELEYTADALGMDIRAPSMVINQLLKVEGPLGLKLSLDMRYSHGFAQDGMVANCWKVLGNLYIAIVILDKHRTVAILLDKGRWTSTMNIASHVSCHRSKAPIDTLEKYLTVLGQSVIGVWEKPTPTQTDFQKIGLSNGVSENLVGRESGDPAGSTAAGL